MKTELDDAVSSAEDVKGRFEAAEADLGKVQALHLAAKLMPGEACLVCGSRDHPAPANGRVDHAGLDKAFREAKTAREKAEGKRQKASADFSVAAGASEALQVNFSELMRPEQSAAALRDQVASVRGKIAALGPQIDLVNLEGRLEDVKTLEGASEFGRESARNELERTRQDAAVARGRYDQALVAIPEDVRERTALEAARLSAQATLRARQDAVKEAEEADRLAREASIKAGLEAESAKSAHKQSVGRRGKGEAVYRERLAANGLTEEDYQSHKMWIPTIDADTETVDDYSRKLDLARADKDKAEEAIAGNERPVLAPLEASLQEAENAQKGETDNRRKSRPG